MIFAYNIVYTYLVKNSTSARNYPYKGLRMENRRLKYKYSGFVIVVLLLVFLTSCRSGSISLDELDAEPTSLSPESTQSSELTIALISDETQEPEIIDECFLCHTDKQALIDSAKPAVVLESENSGEG